MIRRAASRRPVDRGSRRHKQQSRRPLPNTDGFALFPRVAVFLDSDERAVALCTLAVSFRNGYVLCGHK